MLLEFLDTRYMKMLSLSTLLNARLYPRKKVLGELNNKLPDNKIFNFKTQPIG